MFFTLKEIVRWLGLTLFEIWVLLVCLLVFSILVALRCQGLLMASWWAIFTPLFVSDALNAYFCVIVFIRTYLEGTYKNALLRAAWSAAVLVVLFVFKFLLCSRLNGQSTLEYSEVMSPVFILLQLVMIRACQLH